MAEAAVFARSEGITSFRQQLADKLFTFSVYDQLDTGWQLTGDDSRVLFTKLMGAGKHLGEEVGERLYYGVRTGLNEAFMIDPARRDQLAKDDPRCASIIKPMVRGEDLRPWYQEHEGRWLIFTSRGIDILACPSVRAYLQQFAAPLQPLPIDCD